MALTAADQMLSSSHWYSPNCSRNRRSAAAARMMPARRKMSRRLAGRVPATSCARAELGADFAAAFESAGKGDLIGVFQVAANRQAASQASDAHVYAGQLAGDEHG